MKQIHNILYNIRRFLAMPMLNPALLRSSGLTKTFLIILYVLAWSAGAWGQSYTTQYVVSPQGDSDIQLEDRWSSTTDKEYSWNGPGKTLKFEHKTQWSALGEVEVYVTDVNGKETKKDGFGNNDSWTAHTIELDQNIRKIRFHATKTERKWIRRVEVTRATTLSFSETDYTTSSTTIPDFGLVLKGESSSKKTITFYFNNTLTNRTLKVTSSSSEFVVDNSTLTLGASGNKSVGVTFKPTSVGSKTATIKLTLDKLTANGITVDKKEITINVSGTGTQTYTFSANAIANREAYGSANATVDASITSSNTSESKTATFTATANSGYDFIGWATSASATSSTITDNPHDETLTATEAYPNQSKTLYAIFKPYFKFSATAVSSNTTLGTATGSVTNKIQGDVDATSMSATATFTATPADDDCLFLGWFASETYSGEPVSMNRSYSVTLNNNTVGSTESKKLYALFKKKQNLQWANADMDLNLVLGATGLSSAATVTSNKTITYTSSNTDALTIASNGAITTVGLGSSTVTATVAGDDVYREETISRTFNVGEKKQASFTPAWGESTSADIKVGTTTTIGLTNIATDATFTISATPAGIISWSRSGNTLTISGDVAGTATLSLAQTGNTYLYGNSATYTITVSKYANTLALAEETKTMEVDDVWTNVITNVGNGNTQVSCNPTGIATYTTANGGTITANAEGTTTFTFTQAATSDHEATTKTLNLTVTKVTNTLSITLPTQEVDVDGTIELEIDGINSPAALAANITNTQLSSTVNNGADVISYENGVITAHNAGTARITFSQPATTKYAASQSYVFDIMVSKVNNTITVHLNGNPKNSLNVARGDQIALAYTSPSNGAYHVELTTGSTSTASLSGNTINAGTTDGVNVWTITQDETYKYEAATATVRIKVNSIAQDPGSVYTGWLNDEKSWDTIGGTGALELDGPGEFITFDAKRTTIWGVSNTSNFYAQYSTDGGSNWTTALTISLDNKDTWYPQSCPKDPLPENTTHVQILTTTGATGSKQVRNVIVTRKTFVRANADQGTNFGETYVDATPYLTKKFTVSYSTTNGGNIEVISNNPRFEVSPSVIVVTPNSDNVGDDATPVEVTVTYKPNKEGYEYAGADAATITISDLFNSAELTFTATANKRSTTIARGSNTETTTTVDGVIDNVFAFTGTSATYPSANSSDDFYYVISHTPSAINNGNGVISYDPATNTVMGLNGGTATLTIYQKSTAIYNATSQAFNFTVNKLPNTTNISLSAATLNVDGTINVQLTNDNSKGAVSATFSNIAYTNEGQNRDGGLLSFDAEAKTLTGVNAGSATVTVTQAETYKYLSKSVTFDEITVNKLPQTLTWDDPDLETGMQKGATLSSNTATSDVGLTPVTYSSGNTSAISVNATTGELTAVEVGSNITITASQAGNYKYLPATLTRQFSVFNKQVPTFVTDAHFTGSSGMIELTCTATITVTGVSTDDDFTIINGDNTIIDVVRDGETITITGLAIGNTTLTLAQAANDDYIAKTQTYNIEVYWPDDFLSLSPTVAPTHEAGIYTKIFLNRTFRVGYNTLVLPFDTDVDELVGSAYDSDEHYWVAQLSAVTLNTQDGYTLYFQKVPNGAISANQPYVLYLGTQVVNPTWVGSFSVSAATAGQQAATTGYSGYADWVMHANYVPGMDMEGKYGIVNANAAMQRGGSGSTLNAYTAYITGPASGGNVKMRSAFVGEDGEMTVIEGVPTDDNDGLFDDDGMLTDEATRRGTMVYGIDGRRRQGITQGLNLIRTADGRTRKIAVRR